MKKQKAPYEATARSPFAGCAIFIAAIAMLVFLIGFSIYALFRQFGEIEKFTNEKPVPIEITPLENKAPELNELAQRLEKFQQELNGDAETKLELSADDLNLAIAHYDAFKELRGTFRIIRIEGETIYISISFPLNGKPRLAREGEPGWIASDARYLNGTLVAHPGLLKKEIVLQLDDIQVQKAKVSPEFIIQMSPYRITERYVTDATLGPAMAKLTQVKASNGKIIFIRNPKETPADMITNAQVDSASNRLFIALGIAATLFLAFAGVVVFIGLRAKAKNI
jgi:hypothetical protein